MSRALPETLDAVSDEICRAALSGDGDCYLRADEATLKALRELCILVGEGQCQLDPYYKVYDRRIWNGKARLQIWVK